MMLEAEAQSYEASSNVVPLANGKAGGSPARPKIDEVIIHVRFHPDARVFTIDCCPEHLSPQEWYMHLRYAATSNYQVFAGGRGVFRIERSRFETILSGARR